MICARNKQVKGGDQRTLKVSPYFLNLWLIEEVNLDITNFLTVSSFAGW